MREVPRLFKYPADVGTFTPDEKGLSILAKELVSDWNLIIDALADKLHQELLGGYTIGAACGTPGIPRPVPPAPIHDSIGSTRNDPVS